MNSLPTWTFIQKSLAENIPVILLYVLESKGSSPGRQGFFMAVNAMGKIQGSIGGGIMEHKFVEMAREQLAEDNTHLHNDYIPQGGQLKKQVHDKVAARNQSGMICSGEQTVWIYRLAQPDKSHVDSLIKSLLENGSGTLQLSPEGILFLKEEPGEDYFFSISNENDWLYKEKTGYKDHLYIIGGGHCALALSKLMRSLDFYIHLYDTREGLNTMELNDFVQEKKIIASLNLLTGLIPPGKNSYVVIMTFGYRTDDEAIRALINKSFKYIGVLGSSKKIEKMFKDYRSEGLPEELLARLHSPVGIRIKSETPEEIAVSIAAEIIKVRKG